MEGTRASCGLVGACGGSERGRERARQREEIVLLSERARARQTDSNALIGRSVEYIVVSRCDDGRPLWARQASNLSCWIPASCAPASCYLSLSVAASLHDDDAELSRQRRIVCDDDICNNNIFCRIHTAASLQSVCTMKCCGTLLSYLPLPPPSQSPIEVCKSHP